MDRSLRERLNSLAISTSDILLPREGVDAAAWAVVACDQFTSQKDYWAKVEELTEGKPSTYNLIFPECYLEDGDRNERIRKINQSMEKYLAEGVFTEYKDCFVLVERTTESGTRYGLMASLDLEAYSYARGSISPIRATEGTILSRIPPRKEIRKHAPLELPHIMVLINDQKKNVIEPLAAKKESLKCIYEADLMLGGGHLKGYLVDSDEDISGVAAGIGELYDNLDPLNPLLYAMGDGNHSLATAKSLYEDLKKEVGEAQAKKSPSRWALVELENIFDPALCFEAIHRVFFNTSLEDLEDEVRDNCEDFTKEKVGGLDEIKERIDSSDGTVRFGLITKDGHYVYSLSEPKFALAASVIQACIDDLTSLGRASVDYIHGADVTEELGAKDGNIGIILADISKETFFDAIIKDGAFPRKTFSIGHAHEKRYYMEARAIR